MSPRFDLRGEGHGDAPNPLHRIDAPLSAASISSIIPAPSSDSSSSRSLSAGVAGSSHASSASAPSMVGWRWWTCSSAAHAAVVTMANDSTASSPRVQRSHGPAVAGALPLGPPFGRDGTASAPERCVRRWLLVHRFRPGVDEPARSIVSPSSPHYSHISAKEGRRLSNGTLSGVLVSTHSYRLFCPSVPKSYRLA